MSKNKNSGFAIIEYSILILLVLGALWVSKDMIGRGIMGHWRGVGDGFSFGRQYDPSRTLDCVFDGELNKWYEQGCFDQQRRSCAVADFNCEKTIINNICAIEACQE